MVNLHYNRLFVQFTFGMLLFKAVNKLRIVKLTAFLIGLIRKLTGNVIRLFLGQIARTMDSRAGRPHKQKASSARKVAKP